MHLHQQVFHLTMYHAFHNILARIENAIDSDDIIAIGENIELKFKDSEVLELKKMLKDHLHNNTDEATESKYIKDLINYL